MKIVSYNIQQAKGKDGRYDLQRSADSLQGADLILDAVSSVAAGQAVSRRASRASASMARTRPPTTRRRGWNWRPDHTAALRGAAVQGQETTW